MRARLGRAWRALKAFGEWGLYEFWKHPGLEVYGKLADRQNLDLMWRLRRGGALEFAHYTGPYRDKEIPRILWIFWAQGEGEASPVVRRCIASWREKNADWDVRVLTLHSASEYVDLSDVGDSLPFRIRANLLRLRLLSQFGGVWADSTTFCHRPLSEWMPLLGGRTGLFMFRSPHDDRWIDNWFIASCPNNPLIGQWENDYGRYISGRTAAPSTYFMMIYILQWRLLTNKDLRKNLRASGGLPAVPAFFLQAYLDGQCGCSNVRDVLTAGFPVSKLNWRLEISEEELAQRFAEVGCD